MKLIKCFLFILVFAFFSCEREELKYPDEETIETYKSQGELWDHYITGEEIKETIR
jgi:hypothetical protein